MSLGGKKLWNKLTCFLRHNFCRMLWDSSRNVNEVEKVFWTIKPFKYRRLNYDRMLRTAKRHKIRKVFQFKWKVKIKTMSLKNKEINAIHVSHRPYSSLILRDFPRNIYEQNNLSRKRIFNHIQIHKVLLWPNLMNVFIKYKYRDFLSPFKYIQLNFELFFH